MAFTVTMGYLGYGEMLGGKGDDLTFGKFSSLFPEDANGQTEFPKITFWYLLPPLTLLFITRFGIPVSTTFLVLTFFAPESTAANARQEFGRLRRRVHLIHLHVHGAEPFYRTVLPEVPHARDQRLLGQHRVLDDRTVAFNGLLVVAVADARFGQHHGLFG